MLTCEGQKFRVLIILTFSRQCFQRNSPLTSVQYTVEERTQIVKIQQVDT